jgi:hypothetical protein
MLGREYLELKEERERERDPFCGYQGEEKEVETLMCLSTTLPYQTRLKSLRSLHSE